KTTTAGDNTFTLTACPVIAAGRALEMVCGTNSASLGYGVSTCSSVGGERIQGGAYSCCTNSLPASWNPVPSGCIHRRWVVLTPVGCPPTTTTRTTTAHTAP